MLMKYLVFMCFILLASCVLVMILYINGGIKENHFTDSNAAIDDYERIASIHYYRATPNQWSLGRGTLLYFF